MRIQKQRESLNRFVLAVSLAIAMTMPSVVSGQAAQRTDWKMHYGEGVQTLTNAIGQLGNPDTVYEKAVIPAENHSGWIDAPDPQIINFSETSKVTTNYPACLQAKWADYTYFQTIVTVNPNTAVTQFDILFSGMDDGSRVTIFNDQSPPGGTHVDASYVKYNQTNTSNLADYMKTGKNRVVITQVDNCATENNLKSAIVKLNHEEIAAQCSCPCN